MRTSTYWKKKIESTKIFTYLIGANNFKILAYCFSKYNRAKEREFLRRKFGKRLGNAIIKQSGDLK